jgi:hypothetical protein
MLCCVHVCDNPTTSDASDTVMQQLVAEHPDIVNQITAVMQHGYVQWACMQALHAVSDHPISPDLQVSNHISTS